MNITGGREQSAVRFCIYGTEKIGKTTLASKFPNPLFIDVENGSGRLDVRRMDIPTSWSMLHAQIDYLIQNRGAGFSTLVIDSIDRAETLCGRHVCAMKQVGHLGEIGYGNGFVALANEFGNILDKLDILKNTGMNIVLIGHSIVKKFELPEEAGAFDMYCLKLEKKTGPLIKEWTDALLFANYRTMVTEIKGKKKAQGQTRVLYCEHTAVFDAGNRFGLNAQIPLSYSSIAHCVPDLLGNRPQQTQQLQEQSQQSPPPPPPPQSMRQVQDPIGDAQKAKANTSAAADLVYGADKQPTGGVVGHTQQTAFNTKLYDLMKTSGIEEQEVRWAVSVPPGGKPSYLPFETPIDNYPEDFVLGMLVAHWADISKYIIANRKSN